MRWQLYNTRANNFGVIFAFFLLGWLIGVRMTIEPLGILFVFQVGKKGKTLLCDTLSFYSGREDFSAEFCLLLIVENFAPWLLTYKRRW